MKINNKLLKETKNSSRGLNKIIQKGAKIYGFVFIHSYPNLDEVLKGNFLIDRPEVLKQTKDLLIVKTTRLKQGDHVFLGVCRLKGVSSGYVEFVENGLAYICGMGTELLK